MAKTSFWQTTVDEAIENGLVAGRHAGLSGDALRKFVSKDFYPFFDRANHPYKVWLRTIAATRFDREDIVDVVRLAWIRPHHDHDGWYGRAVGGAQLVIFLLPDEVEVRLGRIHVPSRVGYTFPPAIRFDLPGSPACSVVEVAEALEATGLFCFRKVDLAAVDAETQQLV